MNFRMDISTEKQQGDEEKGHEDFYGFITRVKDSIKQKGLEMISRLDGKLGDKVSKETMIAHVAGVLKMRDAEVQ